MTQSDFISFFSTNREDGESSFPVLPPFDFPMHPNADEPWDEEVISGRGGYGEIGEEIEDSLSDLDPKDLDVEDSEVNV